MYKLIRVRKQSTQLQRQLRMSSTEENHRSLPCKLFRGFRIPPAANEDNFYKASVYTPRNKDIFIVSYPKCGTTWTQHVVFLLHNKGEPSQDVAQVINSIPFVEQDGFPDNSDVMAFKYHLPFHLTPYSKDSKYIYVARNPKDTCVSYYHFLKALPGYNIPNFDDFYEAFLCGNLPYGDYMCHVADWYDHSNQPNVLFLTYEEMIQNQKDVVLRIAKFLDIEVSKEGILSGVLKHSSFEFMKKHVDGDEYMEKYLRQGTKQEDIETHEERPIMMRKGVVGDWRNYFSKEQSIKMDAKILQNPSLFRMWKDVVM